MPDTKYGIAIDLGTTNIDAVLLDIDAKKEIKRNTISNSQNKISPDIITRIQHVIDNDAGEEFKSIVYDDLNHVIESLLKKTNIEYSQIYKILVVANPAMMHFFLGEDVSALSRFPYESKINGKEIINGTKLNKKLINTDIYSLPIISGYIGSDFISSVIYTNVLSKKDKKLVVDLGTNAEIGLWDGEQLFCASAAAGPAFGYKGSEVISNVATMLKFHLISNTGIIVDTRYKGIISPMLIRSLQLAKAAVKSAIEILLTEGNVAEKDIKEIYLAGVFGELINPWSAMFIGMIPSIDVGKIRSVGNTALNGAKKILLGDATMEDVNEIISKAKVIYLNEAMNFQNVYIRNINF